jgi:hypothetical protein
MKTGFLPINQVWEHYESERVIYNKTKYLQGKLPLAAKKLGFPVHNK